MEELGDTRLPRPRPLCTVVEYCSLKHRRHIYCLRNSTQSSVQAHSGWDMCIESVLYWEGRGRVAIGATLNRPDMSSLRRRFSCTPSHPVPASIQHRAAIQTPYLTSATYFPFLLWPQLCICRNSTLYWRRGIAVHLFIFRQNQNTARKVFVLHETCVEPFFSQSLY